MVGKTSFKLQRPAPPTFQVAPASPHRGCGCPCFEAPGVRSGPYPMIPRLFAMA